MSNMAFEPLPINTSIQNMVSIVDDTGVTKFANDQVSSFNFNGLIPRITEEIQALDARIGMKFIPNDNEGELYLITDIIKDNINFVDIPSNTYIFVYKDANNETQEIAINSNDQITVQYEDWNEKILGDSGWLITSEGNAIFSGVAVRGEIEATTLDVGGADGITYDGNTVTIGASVIINAPLTVGASGNFIVSGSAAQDIISNNTTITGGNIATGKIKSQGYSGPGTASAFSNSGMLINLDDGSITAPNFKIDNAGGAHFKGVVQTSSGTVGGFNLSASQISIAGFTMSTASGISLGSSQQFKVDTQGNLVATSASIIGNIQAKSGTFSGSISSTQIYGASVTSGYFSSQNIVGASINAGILNGQNIIGASVTGGIISGQQLVGGTIIGASGTFTGTLNATSLTASAGSIGGFIITQNSLNANNFAVSTTDGIALGSASQFSVNTSGVLKASTASISGDITANSGRFLGSVGVNGGGLIYAGNDPSTGQRVVLTSSGLFGFDSGNINIFSLPITGSPTIAGFTLINNGITGSGQMANIIIGTRDANAYNITLRGDKTGGQAAAIYTTVNGVATTSNANNGFYLDDNGKMRLAGSNGTLTFDGNNLFVTGAINATSGSFSGALNAATGTFSGNLSAAGGTFTGNISADQITSGTLIGRLLRTNTSPAVTDGNAFSSAGTMAINLSNGTITTPKFRLDSSGNAFFSGALSAATGSFSGALSAATGTFSGNLSAAGGTFTGNLSANQLTSGTIDASIISVTNLNADNISSGTITGRTFRSSAGITATSGNGVYLDASGNVRFATTSASLQFNSGGLTVGGGTISGAVINGGTISGQSGNIGGFTLGSNSFTAGTNPNVVGILTGGTNAFFAGASDTAGTGAKFLVTNAGALTATNANITGAINATSGTFAGSLSSSTGNIGGFTIGANSLTAGSSPNIVGISTGTNAFFANSSTTTGPGTSFNVTNTGILTAVNANLSGIITASGGVFGPTSNPINLINQGTNSVLDMGTIKMVANVTSGSRYGSLRFYETNGTTPVGELNTAATNKTWFSSVGSQNGLVLGTTSDFLYIPTSSPNKRGRYQGNGFEILAADGTTNLLTVGGGTGAVTIGSSTNNKATTVYGTFNVAGGNLAEITNGNFRVYNTSGPYTPFIITNGSSGGAAGAARVTSQAVYDFTNTIASNVCINANAILQRSTASTRKIKKNIEPISASFSILDVQVVQFKYKENIISEEDQRFDLTVPGFIAEQIYEVLPIAADLDNSGEPENWNYRYMIPVMVKTIQDQQRTIEELTNKLYNIEQRLESAGI